MQPDQPLYEELVRRGSRGRWFWRIGSWFCLAGLLGIALVLTLWPLVLYFRINYTGIDYAFALLALAALYTLGSFLKKISYKIAFGEGIDITQYFEKPADDKR
ncbi:MAG: hypothetical protein NTY45_12120 [Elusimicrobia bacterium]|nr:hypothetical protein [Elusimicrobiota bacterium]